MDSAVIQIRTNKKLKDEAVLVAEELGLSLSSLIKAFLKNVTKTKSVTFSVNEEPSLYLIKTMLQAEKEIRSGKYHAFDNPEDSLSFLKKMTK